MFRFSKAWHHSYYTTLSKCSVMVRGWERVEGKTCASICICFDNCKGRWFMHRDLPLYLFLGRHHVRWRGGLFVCCFLLFGLLGGLSHQAPDSHLRSNCDTSTGTGIYVTSLTNNTLSSASTRYRHSHQDCFVPFGHFKQPIFTCTRFVAFVGLSPRKAPRKWPVPTIFL